MVQKIEILTISWLDREYLQNGRRYRQTENDIANMCSVNLVNFGPSAFEIPENNLGNAKLLT